MCSSIQCIATYAWHDNNLCGTNLCNRCLTRIIRINKSHAEICRFTVFNFLTQNSVIMIVMYTRCCWSNHENITEIGLNVRFILPLENYPTCNIPPTIYK